MRRATLMILLMALLAVGSAARAEEPLMWLEQGENALHVSAALEADPLAYRDPVWYRLAETKAVLPDGVEGMISQLYPKVTAFISYNHVSLASSHEFFEGEWWLRDPMPLLAADTLVGGQPVVEQLQGLLRQVGWESPSEPDVFCTVRQAVEGNLPPIANGIFYAGVIPESLWDEVYYLHFEQTFDGHPLEPWIEHTNEEEWETRDASFLVDREGKMVTAYLFPGYQAVSQAAEEKKLLTARQAGENLIRFLQYGYRMPNESYTYRWEINSFTEGLILNRNGTAFPAWHIGYDQIMIDRVTGDEWRSRKKFTINAVTGFQW